ncbi:MAG: phosphorylase [Pseudolabrys sp.]
MIVVVGLAFEARIAAASGVQVICGGDGRNLRPSLHEAIAPGCKGLISFGVAGGLAPDLEPGTCIVGSGVVSADGRLATDRVWSQALLRAMPDAVPGVLAGAPAPVATPAEKGALHRETGALAVDTESHVVAGAAAHHGLPMAAIRVVCDPATRSLPELALRAIRPDGSTDIAALLGALLRRPDQVAGLLQIALDARCARATLLQCCRLLGPDLGLAGAGQPETGVLEGVEPGFDPAVG